MTSSYGHIFRVTEPFVRGIHRSPVNSLHKGQWRGTLVFSLICAWTNGWVNNRDAGDLRRHRAHYDVIVIQVPHCWRSMQWSCLSGSFTVQNISNAQLFFMRCSLHGACLVSNCGVPPTNPCLPPLSVTNLNRWGTSIYWLKDSCHGQWH